MPTATLVKDIDVEESMPCLFNPDLKLVINNL